MLLIFLIHMIACPLFVHVLLRFILHVLLLYVVQARQEGYEGKAAALVSGSGGEEALGD